MEATPSTDEASASHLWIAPRERLLFLHVPKTAGMSMRVYLRNQYLPDEVFPPTSWAEAAKFDHPLQNFRLYSGHYRANFVRKVPPGTRTLVVLREPVSRLLSALRHLRRDPNFHPDHVLARGKTLSEMVRTPEIMASQYNAQVAWLAAIVDPDRVDGYLYHNPDGDAVDVEEPETDEALFERARQALEAVDFIGFTDDLRPVLAQLSDEMDFHPVISFPRLNEARSDAAPADRLGKADTARIRQATAMDQRLYDFAKDLVEQRRVQAGVRRLRDRGHYVVPEGEFEISLQAPIPGSGWYEPETEGGGFYRWTGPEARFTLDLPLASRPYAVQVEFNRRADDADGVFTAMANMVPLVVEQVHVRRRAFQARFTIPTAAIAAGDGAVRLVLDAGAPGRPTDHGGVDDRVLGIVVFRIAVSPVSDAMQPEILIEAIEPTAEPVEMIETVETIAPTEAAQSPVAAEPVSGDAQVAVPIIGYGGPVGPVGGMFADRWVGPNFRLTIQPHRPVRCVTVHGWFHGDTPTDGELSLRIGDQTVVHQMAPGMFVLSVDLPEATLEAIPLAMDATDWIMTEGPEGRKLVFVLQRIVLE